MSSSLTRSSPLLAVVATLVVALPAGAPPPQGEFPSALFPAEGSTMAANGKVYAFGTNAPAPADIGLALRTALGPVPGDSAQLGCCLVVFRPAALLPPGPGAVLLSYDGVDLETNFTVVSALDETPPVLGEVTILDDRPGGLLVAIETSDDDDVIGFIAEREGAVASAAPIDTLLELRGYPAGTCFDVYAIDGAGQQSDAMEVCDRGRPNDPEPVEPEPGPDGGVGCSAIHDVTGDASSPLVAFFALFFLFGTTSRKRNRKRAPFAPRATKAFALAPFAIFVVAALSGCPGPGPVDGGATDGGAGDGGASDGGAVDGGGASDGTLTTLESVAAFESLQNADAEVRYLAAVDGRASEAPVNDGCRFQDDAVYAYHLQYLQAERGDDYTLDDYTAMTLDRATRVWWGGELAWRPQAMHPITNAPGVLLFLVYATDDATSALTADDVRAAFAALTDCTPGFADQLAFVPGSISQRQMAESERLALQSDGIGVVLQP